jgi:hypothetical protein
LPWREEINQRVEKPEAENRRHHRGLNARDDGDRGLACGFG